MSDYVINLQDIENQDFSKIRNYCKSLGLKVSKYDFLHSFHTHSDRIKLSMSIVTKKNFKPKYSKIQSSTVLRTSFSINVKNKKDKFLQSCREDLFDLTTKRELFERLKEIQTSDEKIQKGLKSNVFLNIDTVSNLLLHDRPARGQEEEKNKIIQSILFQDKKYKNLMFSIEVFNDHKSIFVNNINNTLSYTYAIKATNKENCSASMRITNIFGYDQVIVTEKDKHSLLYNHYDTETDYNINKFNISNKFIKKEFFSAEGKTFDIFVKECEFLNQENFLDKVMNQINEKNIKPTKFSESNDKIKIELNLDQFINQTTEKK